LRSGVGVEEGPIRAVIRSCGDTDLGVAVGLLASDMIRPWIHAHDALA